MVVEVEFALFLVPLIFHHSRELSSFDMTREGNEPDGFPLMISSLPVQWQLIISADVEVIVENEPFFDPVEGPEDVFGIVIRMSQTETLLESLQAARRFGFDGHQSTEVVTWPADNCIVE